jgi:hypothetical protein
VLRLRAQPGAVPLGAILLASGAMVAVAVALLHLDRLPFSLCVFHAVTGWPCMTCGATRAAARLAVGDVPGALSMNPLATIVGLALVPWGVSDLALLPRGRALSVEVAPAGARALRVGLVLAVAVNWAYLIAAGR